MLIEQQMALVDHICQWLVDRDLVEVGDVLRISDGWRIEINGHLQEVAVWDIRRGLES